MQLMANSICQMSARFENDKCIIWRLKFLLPIRFLGMYMNENVRFLGCKFSRNSNSLSAKAHFSEIEITSAKRAVMQHFGKSFC